MKFTNSLMGQVRLHFSSHFLFVVVVFQCNRIGNLFTMNGFPCCFFFIPQVGSATKFIEYTLNISPPTYLPLSLDMIFICDTKKRIVYFFFWIENVKEPNNPKTTNPGGILTLFHTNGPPYHGYIWYCGMWTQSHCGVHAKHGV